LYNFKSTGGGRRQVAVVGAGVAGLAAAWLLSKRHDVTLYEAAGRLGGHAHTVDVDPGGPEGPVAVDTGFIVYNERNYPHLSALFSHLGVETAPSDMSFAVSVGDGSFEFAGDRLGTLFDSPRRLLDLGFHRMLVDVLRFNRAARRIARTGKAAGSLGGFLAAERLGSRFRDHYLLPMAAAIWSCPTRAMLEFPAVALARFFDNHGLLDLTDRPAWRTVRGGSQRYVERLATPAVRARTDHRVVSVRRDEAGVRLRDATGHDARHDAVVIAAHADQALALLDDATPMEAAVLSSFRYQRNRAVLHTDPALMPRRRRLWASWNYLAGPGPDPGADEVSVTYWMNRLQPLETTRDWFVSLNPLRPPDPTRVAARMDYDHPVFDGAATAAQPQLATLQGIRGTWFCGSYHGYGFHEDALVSALGVAGALGCPAPWRVERPVQPQAGGIEPEAEAVHP
jgi:uncharacterized protein